MPASRSALAMIFAPRSWPSRPGLATTTRILGAGEVLIGSAAGRGQGEGRDPGPLEAVAAVGGSARSGATATLTPHRVGWDLATRRSTEPGRDGKHQKTGVSV